MEPDLREPARCFEVGRAQLRGMRARRERERDERGRHCSERRVASAQRAMKAATGKQGPRTMQPRIATMDRAPLISSRVGLS